jgi:ribokinase
VQARPRITVIGSFNTDMMVRAPRMPQPGETILGTSLVVGAGGKGANQAIAAARLGAEVHMVACVGADEFGRSARALLGREGVGIEHVRTLDTEATGAALIIVDDVRAENMIVVAPGANRELTPEDVDAALECIAASDVVLMQLETALDTVAHAAAVARRCGARVVLNPAPAATLSPELLAMVDVLTPNETEAALLAEIGAPGPNAAEEAARVLLAQGCGAVVVTLGPAGALVADAAGMRRIAPFRVDAVDTTGAGDAFNGALSVALAEGKALDEACAFANAAAAISTTRPGTAASMPTRDEVGRLMGC